MELDLEVRGGLPFAVLDDPGVVRGIDLPRPPRVLEPLPGEVDRAKVVDLCHRDHLGDRRDVVTGRRVDAVSVWKRRRKLVGPHG